MPSADSARYDDAKEVKPMGSRTASTGSVHDPRSGKYPSTHTFASSKEENASKVAAGIAKRRPGGSLRSHRGLSCTCGKHLCTCGNAAAHKTIIHCDVNE